jgi:hypothetical protein
MFAVITGKNKVARPVHLPVRAVAGACRAAGQKQHRRCEKNKDAGHNDDAMI